MKQDFQFNINSLIVNEDSMKVIQSKNGIIMNIAQSVKYLVNGGLVEMAIRGILVRLILNVIKLEKPKNSQILKLVYIQNVYLVKQYPYVKMKYQIQLNPLIKKNETCKTNTYVPYTISFTA